MAVDVLLKICLAIVVLELTNGTPCLLTAHEWWDAENQVLLVLFPPFEDESILQGVYGGKLGRVNDSANYYRIFRNIYGYIDYKHNLFTFSLHHEEDRRIITWTGQCFFCNGKKKLVTSWVMKESTALCSDNWKTNYKGSDIFEPFEYSKADMSGPIAIIGDRYSRDPYAFPFSCPVDGKWHTGDGAMFDLQYKKDTGVINGTFYTNSANKSSSRASVAGFYGNEVFGLLGKWPDKKFIISWAGQCHICENDTKVIHVVWVKTEEVKCCEMLWNAVTYGVISFKEGPSKDMETEGRNKWLWGRIYDYFASFF